MIGYAKIIAIIAVLAIIAGGYLYVTNLQKDNARLTSELSVAQLANKTLVAEKEDFVKRLDISKAEQDKLNEKLSNARDQMNRMVRLFADHDFSNLAAKKPGLVSLKMKKATEKLFKEIELESKK